MTSRDRVLNALNHEETDRAPIDFGGMRSTGIMSIAYSRLKEHLGLEHDTLQYDLVQGLAHPHEEILDLCGVDVLDPGRAWYDRPEDWRDWTLQDGTPARVPAWFDPEPDGDGGWRVRGDEGQVVGVMPRSQAYITQAYWPLSDDAHGLSARTLEDLQYHMSQVTWSRLGCPPWHPGFDESRWAEMRTRIADLRGKTDRALMCAFGGNLLEWGQFLRGFGQFMLDLVERPRDAHMLLDALLDLHLRNADRFCEAVGDLVEVVHTGDDLGTQHGPQISPAMHREFFLPRQKRLNERIHEKSQMKVFFHSCGGIYPLIPHLIEAGVDILNPVQTACADMGAERLKREFGKDLVFWGGGCETQSTLVHGTPEDVRRQVRERVGIFGAGGGFVFNQIHNVLNGVPPENVVAMFEAAQEA